MRAFLLKIEPLIWLMFGQGILIGTMLLTGWILVVGLLIPLGVVDAGARLVAARAERPAQGDDHAAHHQQRTDEGEQRRRLLGHPSILRLHRLVRAGCATGRV